jgi:hypothetical protein
LNFIVEILRTEFRANKPSDVISTLVSIYDSKDLFVKELQILLAQRLLAIKDDSMEKVEKEVRFLCFVALIEIIYSKTWLLLFAASQH